MATDDGTAFLPGASQATRGMLPAIPFQGDSGRFGRRGIHFEPMIQGILLKNLKNKACRRASPLGLTPAARGHNIFMDRGVYFLRQN